MAKTREELNEHIFEYIKTVNGVADNNDLYLESLVLVSHVASISDPTVSLYSTYAGPEKHIAPHRALGLLDIGKGQMDS